MLYEATKPKAGEMEVILAAGESGILLHEAMGHAFEADFNRKKTSIFSDKMGQKVGENFVTIVDDGTIPGNRGAINVDDEGNPTEKTILVNNGILSSYLHDRISASYYKVKPTGNGRRQDFRNIPIPRMRSIGMVPTGLTIASKATKNLKYSLILPVSICAPVRIFDYASSKSVFDNTEIFVQS